MKTTLFCMAVLCAMMAWASGGGDYRYWPVQAAPKAVARTHFDLFEEGSTEDGSSVDPSLGPEHMLAQSLAGLAAKAVNEGRFDEMVWIGLENDSYDLWYAESRARLRFEERGTYTPWELVERYQDKGIYEGYILYDYDYSDGPPTAPREDMDESVNVATSLAGLMKGLLISEELKAKADAMGLEQLADVRQRDENWCFEQYKDRCNRRFVLTQDPKMPNHRAIAIAHDMFTIYGTESPSPEVYAWLHPLSSILGWADHDEGGFVSQLSEYGHILLPSNWCVNVTVTSAASHEIAEPEPQITTRAPEEIDWDYEGDAVSFIMSDGDNVQWMMGDFCFHRDYWASLDHGKYPIGWGAPYACLDEACPPTRDYLAQTQRSNATLLLHAGGYYYPDLLGKKLDPEVRADVLRRNARRLNHYMKRSGGTTLMFLCMDLDSEDARAAYKVFAEEIDNLTGMFAIQYYPYEAGDGEIFWTANREGVEIPVITAKYAIWANIKQERAGTPAKIARLINEDAQADPSALYAWTTVHTWSGFKETEGDDEDAENDAFGAPGTHAAVTPTKWCVDRLDNVRVVSPEELAWRIRMRHNPEQTRALATMDTPE